MKFKNFLAKLEFFFTSIIPRILISLLFTIYTPVYLIIKCFKLFHFDDSRYRYSIYWMFDDYKTVWKRIWDIALTK